MRIVGILDGQLWQRNWFPCRVSTIERGKFAEEDIHRPAIKNNVVDRQYEYMGFLIESEQRSTQEGTPAQVKRGPGLFAGQLLYPILRCLVKLDRRQRHRHKRSYYLHWLSID